MVRLNFDGYDNTFKLRVRQYKNLFAPNMKVNFVRSTGELEVHHVDQTKWFVGTMVGAGTEGSTARVHIADDGLRATINVADEIYRIEPLNRSETRQARAPPEFNHVIYAHRNVRSSDGNHGSCGFDEAKHGEDAVHENHRRSLGDDALRPETETRERRAASRQPYSSNNATIQAQLRTVCQMHLVSDHHFFNSKGSSVTAATDAMIEFLADTNSNYRNTKFDGTTALDGNHMYNNKLQFAAAQITVFESNADLKDSNGNIHIAYPWSNGDTTSADDFLNFFSYRGGQSSNGASDLISKNDPDICLSHAFTKQDFDRGKVGQAWHGTVCRGLHASGITTTINFGEDVAYTQNQLVVAHEIGHNIGMKHDGYAHPQDAATSSFCFDFCKTDLAYLSSTECEGDFLNTKGGNDCCSSDDKIFNGLFNSGGRYAMWPTSVDGSDANNAQFSACSRFLANQVIVGQGKDSCFTAPVAAICGNGIVEDGEDCDCGVTGDDVWFQPSDVRPYTYSDTQRSLLSYCQTSADNFNADPCCLPNCKIDATNEGSRPDGNAECSAQTGSCCGAEIGEQCKRIGFDIDNDFVDFAANPATPKTASLVANGDKFVCRANTECIEAAYCVTSETYEGICPISHLEKKLQAAIVAGETNEANEHQANLEGFYKANGCLRCDTSGDCAECQPDFDLVVGECQKKTTTVTTVTTTTPTSTTKTATTRTSTTSTSTTSTSTTTTATGSTLATVGDGGDCLEHNQCSSGVCWREVCAGPKCQSDACSKCDSNGDCKKCEFTHYVNNGGCEPKMINGAACYANAASSCDSGVCKDGTCAGPSCVPDECSSCDSEGSCARCTSPDTFRIDKSRSNWCMRMMAEGNSSFTPSAVAGTVIGILILIVASIGAVLVWKKRSSTNSGAHHRLPENALHVVQNTAYVEPPAVQDTVVPSDDTQQFFVI